MDIRCKTIQRTQTAGCGSRMAVPCTRAMRAPVTRKAMSDSAQAFIDKSGIQKKIEDALNAAAKAHPEDPTSFLVRVQLQWHISPHPSASLGGLKLACSRPRA